MRSTRLGFPVRIAADTLGLPLGQVRVLRHRFSTRATAAFGTVERAENAGNFALLSLPGWLPVRNSAGISTAYEVIPYALEQGIYSGLTGN
jgi:hypothetical protein